MTVGETAVFVGAHHHGFVPIGLPDDGYGNGVWKTGELGIRHPDVLGFLRYLESDKDT